MGSVCEDIYEYPREQSHQNEAKKEACAEARPCKEKKESFSGRVASSSCAASSRFITNQLIRAAWLVSRYRFQRFEGECLFHTTVDDTHTRTHAHKLVAFLAAVAASRSTSSHHVESHLNLMTSPAATRGDPLLQVAAISHSPPHSHPIPIPTPPTDASMEILAVLLASSPVASWIWRL